MTYFLVVLALTIVYKLSYGNIQDFCLNNKCPYKIIDNQINQTNKKVEYQLSDNFTNPNMSF